MKPLHLTIVLTLLLPPFFSKAQYHPFPDGNAQWTIRYETENCMGDYSEYQYQVSGDTIINSLTYHKLRVDGSFNCGNPSISGAFRNDNVNKRVYFMHADSIVESILYDFNLVQGDTIKGYLEEISNTILGYNNVCIIDSIDSVLINGAYRNRWNYHSISLLYDFSNAGKPSYIEGLGNTLGLFEGLKSFLNLSTNLVCHEANDTTLYSIEGGDCFPLSVDVFLNEKEELVHPNPFNESLYLSTYPSIDNIVITNIMGEIVYQSKDIRNKKIELEFLQAGIYIMQLKNRNKIYNTRIIKK